jgi:hypothetical protein
LFTFDERDYRLDASHFKRGELSAFARKRIRLTFRQNSEQFLKGIIRPVRIHEIKLPDEPSLTSLDERGRVMLKGSITKEYIGIWMDRRRAIIVSARKPGFPDDGETKVNIAEMASGVEKRVRTAGGSRTAKVPWGPQQTVAESKLEARHQRQLSLFYNRLLAQVRDAQRIFVMGPGETKDGFVKTIEKDPTVSRKLAGVETRDKMTPRQAAAKVKAFFGL